MKDGGKQTGKELGPGVPEALPQVVQRFLHHTPVETIDRLWLFPPMIRGRKETGLVAASCFAPLEEDATRRRLLTAPYTAERTGKGLVIESSIEEEGTAPADRLPRVMHGVVVRSGMPLGEATELEIGGDAAVLDQWFTDEVEPDHLDPALPPLAVQAELEMEPSEGGADPSEVEVELPTGEADPRGETVTDG